ncbi:DUF2333 family protein [Sneathiella chinensis]|uniref:DUF2333 domain-containing protein n=1 Tax=Sneathiella chinensis TaxID=349750 RepID=A0ABQ5U0F4_9PROT|nr:DUF2333 family protein [Sneathiella chinensis]GLQ05218.1 hypothetical protein GCM10007924_04390 [Sneathiella chinensis]
MSEIGTGGSPVKTRGTRLGRGGRKIAYGLVLAILLYYVGGMIWIHKIDDDLKFTPSEENRVAGGSQTVAMVAGLIDREINDNRWTANDPFFMPAALLDNMPNYQQGIVSALARFTFELTDQIGRTRGSSQTDPDLQEAAGLLQYSGTKWVWDPTVSLLPTAASEKQYEKARVSLNSYNRRLAEGRAVFEKRGDNLLATLDRIALDIGSSTATIDKHIAETSGAYIDFQADDLFYGFKGQGYAYYMILQGLSQDYEGLIRERELGNAWSQMLDSFRSVVELDPMVISNAKTDGQLFPNHLTAQGFYLLRARTQLREISNILLK